MSGDIFPSIVPESAHENGDDVYTRAQLEAMDYEELRSMAAAVDTDAVDGKSTKLEMIDYFAGQSTLQDYGSHEE